MQKEPFQRFFEKALLRNFAKFTKKQLCSKNETLSQVLSCGFCKNTFLENTTGQTASDYSTINRGEGRINKQSDKL